MATRYIDYDAPHIPMRRSSWFIQLMMVLAALVIGAMVYGFWNMANAPSPRLDLPAGAVTPDVPDKSLPPTNEQAP